MKKKLTLFSKPWKHFRLIYQKHLCKTLRSLHTPTSKNKRVVYKTDNFLQQKKLCKKIKNNNYVPCHGNESCTHFFFKRKTVWRSDSCHFQKSWSLFTIFWEYGWSIQGSHQGILINIVIINGFNAPSALEKEKSAISKKKFPQKMFSLPR